MKEEETATEDVTDTLTTGPLTPPDEGAQAKSATEGLEVFKVKLQPTHSKPEDEVKEFAYTVGGMERQWKQGDGYEFDLFTLESARSFMEAAIATGGMKVAEDSPTSLKTKFKVKLTRKPGPPAERVTLFSYVDGERYDHFDASSGDEFEKEFDDLSKARTFIDGAIDSGGFTVADDSPVKLKA